MKIGVLALQGAVEPHENHLKRLSVSSVRVKKPEHLEGISGLILPGGESSTMLHLLQLNGLWAPLKKLLPTIGSWGVCAGAILLAKKVTDPEQDSFAQIEIEAERNAYGTQLDSFVDDVVLHEPLRDARHDSVEGVFIRAPRLRPISPEVRVLGTHGKDSVILEQGNVLVSAFHPELTDSTFVLEYFLTKCKKDSK